MCNFHLVKLMAEERKRVRGIRELGEKKTKQYGYIIYTILLHLTSPLNFLSADFSFLNSLFTAPL